MNTTLAVIGIVVGLPLYYATGCVFWPYAKCWRCRGTARRSALWGGGFQLCGTCGATGRRLKLGRAIYNYFRNL